MELITLKLKSTHPLLMHADRYANPLDLRTKAHKELTSKRKKTDDDHEAIARSEYMGSLYINPDGPYIPSFNLDAAFVDAAKLQKLGRHSKRAMMVVENHVYLEYDGPKTPDGLWNDKRFVDSRSVRVSTARLMRYRPMFDTWTATCTLMVNPDQLSINEIKQIVTNAGQLIGVGDYRPRFGRFAVEFVGV